MAQFFLVNVVILASGVKLLPGALVDDTLQPTAPIIAAGGTLISTSNLSVAAAAAAAQNAHKKGANEIDMQAIMSAALFQNTFMPVPTVIFGGGDDGKCVFDGVLTFPFATLAGTTYTLTADCFLSDQSVVNAGITIKTAGFKVYCNGTLTNNGSILCDGNAAALGVAGAASALGTSGIGVAGGAGSAGVGVGAAGTNQANTVGDADLSRPAGGAGGAGGADAGGAGGTYTVTGTNSGAHNLVSMTMGLLFTQSAGAASLRIIGGGAGGGGGGSDNAGITGGGGGGGGGVMVLAVFNLVNNGTIRAAGGAGAAASGAGGNGGGGGGGGGGVILNVTRTSSGTGTMTAPGGVGGAAFGGTGVAGTAGTAGQVHQHAA